MTSRGSCLCGAVAFEVEGAIDAFFLCHCSRCRKDTGSAHAANLFARGATLRWLSGQEGVSAFTLPGTRHARSFCATCGSALPSVQMDGGLVVIPAGSLDDPVPLRPAAHICMAGRADWDEALDEIPRLDGLPG